MSHVECFDVKYLCCSQGAASSFTMTSPALETDSTERLIAPPPHSDLLTDFNTIKNINIPPPVWANLDKEYRDMMGLPAPAELNLIEGGGVVILKADGTPLQRLPPTRKIPVEDYDDDEDEETQAARHKMIVIRPNGRLAEMKAAAARRRGLNPNPLALATDERKERVAAAREEGHGELRAIEEWDNAVNALNKQRDDEVVRIIEEQRRLGSGSAREDMKIEYRAPEVGHSGEDDGRFVEIIA